MSKKASGKKAEYVRSEPLWQDRDLRFDASLRDLQLRRGEKIVRVFDKVEDTKGNSGDEGTLRITSLRLIWQSKAKPRINLTIGFNCITSITNRSLHSKLRGKYDALHIMTKVSGTRYEFIFTQMDSGGLAEGFVLDGPQMAPLLSQVCRAYSCSKLYRDLKLRSAVIANQGKQLKTLPSEQIYNKINGVWNLSSDQGNLGVMHITNVRVVWHANMNEYFNLSLPYLQINCIRVRESKFGVALVVETSESTGGYVLGFRLDPIDRLKAVYNELINLYNVHASNPSLGVEECIKIDGDAQKFLDYYSDAVSTAGSLSASMEGDFVEEGPKVKTDAIAAYLADDSAAMSKDNHPVYCPELGLAIEKVKDGYTLESLWNVIPAN